MCSLYSVKKVKNLLIIVYKIPISTMSDIKHRSTCVVPQCPSKSKDPSHHFRQKEDIAQKWVAAVKNQKLLSSSHKELVKQVL
ncbi:hypothetical protein WN55_08864 [Dufourea novaeangliae]|uniref:THAP-type domain-containing protein n=1 Tax=Dufourea novaeangliae TaxID=178035 RepID=A0A154P062_DUFNO|nr:hypothetical protein WN55_08864 [Dufourea novaeangliae]